MIYIREKAQSIHFIPVSHVFRAIIFDSLKGVKVGLITWGQREENSKLVRTGQFCTLFPDGGVVWKIPYRPVIVILFLSNLVSPTVAVAKNNVRLMNVSD